MHILVVDDDIPTVEVIRTSLHWDLLGIDRVETAYDYTEAQNKIRPSQPDIILCDIEMPRGSGLDLLRWLRENTFCTWFDALSVLIPAGYGLRGLTGWSLVRGAPVPEDLSLTEQQVLSVLRPRRKPLPAADLYRFIC